ncbi:MAG: LolA family protein [Planctomycetota bacterium]
MPTHVPLVITIVASFMWFACTTPPVTTHPVSTPRAAQDKQEEPPAAQTQPDEIADAGRDETVDELLAELERSAADLHAFTAGVVYEVEDALLGRRERRRGKLIYSADEEADSKRFAVLFESIDFDNGRRERRLRHYVFDGQWLAEIDHESRKFIKRQIVRPGERLDPLKLGEGPFPLPIGQPREQVHKRFVASSWTLPEGHPLEKVGKTYPELRGLLLVPRDNTPEARDYARVELLYDRATLLPVGIQVIETNGDRKTVRLLDPVRNPTLDEQALAWLSIEEPDRREWAVSVQPWSGRQD